MNSSTRLHGNAPSRSSRISRVLASTSVEAGPPGDGPASTSTATPGNAIATSSGKAVET